MLGDTSKTSCCYHLLVQDPGPVYPGPHIRDVELFVEGSVLCTQLRHTVVELLDAAKEKRHTCLCQFGGGRTKVGFVKPRFHSKTQATLLSLCDTGLLQQWRHLSWCSPSPGMSQELQPRRKMQRDQGCPFSARKQLFPPDFH